MYQAEPYNPKLVNFSFDKLQSLVSDLTYSHLRKNHLLIIASKALGLQEEPLTDAELSYLANETSLPLLQSLVQSKQTDTNSSLCYPILYIPFVSWLRRHGSKKTLAKLEEKLAGISNLDGSYVLFDSWLSSRPLENLLELWHSNSKTTKLKLIGPNYSELIQLEIERKSELPKILAYLRAQNIAKIECASNLDLLKCSLEANLSCTFTQAIAEDCPLAEDFINSILTLKKLTLANPHGKVAWSIKKLVSNVPIANMFRAIAVARLILPPQVEIIAPCGLLGFENSKFALQLGASSQGFVAVDTETAELLKLPRYSLFINQIY